jgi:hypothetical protein
MRIGRGNGSTRKNPAPVPLRPAQSPYELTWAVRWLPTAAAQDRSQVRSCGICGQCGTGEGSLRVLRFPLPILIPPTAP